MTATAKKNNMRIIAVVMGEPTSKMRNKEISEMLDYSFAQYKIKDLLKNKKSFGKYKVYGGSEEFVNIVPKDSATVLKKIGEESGKISYDVNIDKLSAPLKVGDSIGKVAIKENDKVIRNIDVTVDKNIIKLSFLKLFIRNIIDMITGNINISHVYY